MPCYRLKGKSRGGNQTIRLYGITSLGCKVGSRDLPMFSAISRIFPGLNYSQPMTIMVLLKDTIPWRGGIQTSHFQYSTNWDTVPPHPINVNMIKRMILYRGIDARTDRN